MKVSILTTLLAICLVAFTANVNCKSVYLNSIEINMDSKSIEGSNDDNGVVNENTEASSSAEPGSSSEAPQQSSSAASESSSNAPEETTIGAPIYSSNAPEETTDASESSSNASSSNAPESSSNAPEETTSVSTESSNETSTTTTSTETPVETTQSSGENPDNVQTENLEKFVEEMFNNLGKFVASIIDSVSKDQTIIKIPNYIIIRPVSQEKLPIEHNPLGHRIHPFMSIIQKPVPMEDVEIEPRTFKTLWWLLKSILKTLRGINCTIKGVVNVKESTDQMLNDFHGCSVEASKQIQAVLDSAQKVISISNDIMSINNNVCNNSDYLADVDSSQKASSKCVKQLRSKILNLNSQIKTTTKLIKKVPSNAGDCVSTTFSTYQQSIIGFPDFVKTCAKL